MTKTITKQAFVGIFAALFAVLMAMALAPSAYADDAPVAFTVLKQVATGVDADGNIQYGDATAEKTYTADELKAIAVNKGAAEAPGYNKYAKNNFAYAATSYVELSQFAKDAGIDNVGDIALMRFVTSGFSYDAWKADPSILQNNLWSKENNITHDMWSGISGKALASDLMFFPNQRIDADENNYSTEGAVAVPSILALAYGRQAIEAGATAADALVTAAAASEEGAWTPLFGATAEYFAANGPEMGNTMPSGVVGVLILVDSASIADATVSGIADATYTGKAIAPAVKVTLNGTELAKDKDYTVSFKNNVNAGTATVTINGAGIYTGTITKNFKINKASQTIAAKNFSKKLKAKKGKLAKKASLNVKQLAKVNAIGSVKYAKANKAGASKIAVSKAGKITVKKGLKKGKYVVKIKITSEKANYNTATKTIKATITVK